MNKIVTSTSNINRLHDYLNANVSGFRRVVTDDNGIDVATSDSGYVEGSESEVTISFAYDLPNVLIQTAIHEFHNQ
jgi:hypothetical protein